MCGLESLLYGLREKEIVSTSLFSQGVEGSIIHSLCWQQQWMLGTATLKDKMKIQNQKYILKEKITLTFWQMHLPLSVCSGMNHIIRVKIKFVA